MFGFLAYWWIGVAGLDDRFTKHFRRGYFLPLVVAWIAATVLLMQGAVSTPLLVEVRKLLFALLVAGGLGLLDQVRAGARATEMFGRAGYSIYAFHAPVVYTLIIAGAPWWAACAAAVCVGLLMFFTVEKPFERLGRKVAYGRAVPTAPGRTSGLLQMSDRRSAASRSAEEVTPPA